MHAEGACDRTLADESTRARLLRYLTRLIRLRTSLVLENGAEQRNAKTDGMLHTNTPHLIATIVRFIGGVVLVVGASKVEIAICPL